MSANTSQAATPGGTSGPSLKTRVFQVDAIGLLAALGLAAGAYFLGVAPVFEAHARVEETRRLINEQTRHADDTEEMLATARLTQQAMQRQLDATAVKLMPASDLNRRLAVISELVEKNALELQALDPGTPTTDPAIGKFALVPIRLSGVGFYASVSAFLHELLAERFKDMEVRSMSIAATANPSPSTSAPGQHDLAAQFVGPENPNPPEVASFTIELRWYAAPAASAVSAADGPAR